MAATEECLRDPGSPMNSASHCSSFYRHLSEEVGDLIVQNLAVTVTTEREEEP